MSDRRKQETAIQRAIIEALEATGALVIRVNSGVVKVRRGWQHGAAKGTADLLVFPRHGGALALEVKVPGERLRPDQEAFRDDWIRRGHRHAVVTTIEDAIRAVDHAPPTR